MSLDIFGSIAGTLVVMAYAPQAIQTIRSRRTRDLSLATYLMVTLASLCWVIYGIGKHSVALWLANGIVGVFALIITLLKLHGDRVDRGRPDSSVR